MTRKIALSVLCLLLTVLALFSGWKIYSELSARQKEKDEFSALAALVEPPATEPSAAVVPEEATTPEKSTEPAAELRDLTELFAQNPDCIGWLCVPGTQIDYPVMFTPEEPQRYLRRSFYGAYSQSGVPFMDFRCDENSNLILYGHNMKNGTMFREILQYANKSYWQEHPMIKFNTLYEQGEYDVLAAFYDRVYYADENCFKFYRFIKAADKADYDNAIQNYKEKSLYDTGVTAEYGDKLITLVTCSYHKEHGRFVVVARQR